MKEKLQVAQDKSYEDPTNLEKKLRRHQEFVAEVKANEDRIQDVAKVPDVHTYVMGQAVSPS